jgi:hypothetical protein
MSTSGTAFETGFYNDPNPNVVWTSAYRNLAVTPNEWENFASAAAVNLPAGDHTIYWKIWITGATLTLSSGSLLVEGFEGVGSTFNVAEVSENPQSATTAANSLSPRVGTDAFGQAITLAAGP